MAKKQAGEQRGQIKTDEPGCLQRHGVSLLPGVPPIAAEGQTATASTMLNGVGVAMTFSALRPARRSNWLDSACARSRPPGPSIMVRSSIAIVSCCAVENFSAVGHEVTSI